MTTMFIPGTYKLDVDLSSDWSVEMKFKTHTSNKIIRKWAVETNLPFDITTVIERNGEYYFYDDTMKELLERWHNDDAELRDFFRDEKKDFLAFLKIISPVDSWKLIS